MKVSKSYLRDRIQYYFLFLFSFTVILFNPSKEFLGVLSITDIFVILSMTILPVHVILNRDRITNRFLLLLFLFIFSFLALLINEQFYFIHKIKYHLRWVLYILMFFIIYNYINLKSLNYFKKGLFYATYIVCIYALLQFFFKKTMIPTIFWIHSMPDYIEITFRAVGTFDNPLNLCGFLAFPLGILQYTQKKTKKEKILNLLIYLTLIVTISKIGFIILFVSLLVYFKKYIKLIIYGFVAVTIMIIGYLNIPDDYLNESYIHQRVNSQKEISQSVNTRLHMIESSLILIKKNPIFGISYENFEKHYVKNIRETNELRLSSTSFTSENFLLDFYLDNGLIPFLIIFLLLLEMVMFFYTTDNYLIMQFTFSIILFIIVGLVMSARIVPLMYLLFTFLAIVYKIKNNEQNVNSNNSKLLL